MQSEAKFIDLVSSSFVIPSAGKFLRLLINYDQLEEAIARKRFELKSDEALINHLNDDSFAHWDILAGDAFHSKARLMAELDSSKIIESKIHSPVNEGRDALQRNLRNLFHVEDETFSALLSSHDISKARNNKKNPDEDNLIKMSPAGEGKTKN
jgi:hypothetical protein